MQFIPEIPPESVFNVYRPSAATLQLESEKNHAFHLQLLKWIRNQPDPLYLMCLLPALETAQGDPERFKIPVVNCAEAHAYLPTDLSLPQTIHIVPDGYYWKRSAVTHWTDRVHDVTKFQASWKRLYAEQHLQDYIENYEFKKPSSGSLKVPAWSIFGDPEEAIAEDESDLEESPSDNLDKQQNPATEVSSDLQKGALEDLNEMLELYKPYVKRLVITNMIPFVPEGEQIKKDQAYDHLKLDVFITAMENLEELALLYKYDNKHSKVYLRLSCSDCASLGQGLASANHVLIFRLRRIFLKTAVLESFFKAITGICTSISLQVLDFSSCQINSHGAILLSKFLHCIPNLKELRLHSNDIGSSGGHALGNSLGQVKLPLEKLDISRNPLGDSPICDILCPLLSYSFIKEIDFSDCRLTYESIWKFRSFLVLNRTVKSLSIRNNPFGKNLGKPFLKGLLPNLCIENLDVANCKGAIETETIINILLELNHFEAGCS